MGFLPLFLLVYFLVPRRSAKNAVLFVASLLFYAWGEPFYVALMLLSILLNWCAGLLMAAHPDRKKTVLALCLALNLFLLGFFKYEGFIADMLNGVLGMTVVSNLNLPLPIGISFYTLQAITYIVDVYRGKVEAQRNLLHLGMYIAMFPQLVAGPIVRYQTICDQITSRKENLRDFTAGARLFTIGLAKKVLLANVVAILADNMLETGGPTIGLVGAWGGIVAFTFQIYFDFAGYSDMAIGLGKMCGFSYLRNFNYPYLSKSITEFWSRWHISLGTFFRDYLYFPLGGSRCSKRRWVLNLLVVWSLTGLWHGAAWNFVFWGLFNLVFLLFEKMVIGKALQRLPRAVCCCYTMLVVMTGLLLFWHEDLVKLWYYAKALLGCYGINGASSAWDTGVWAYLPIFIICAFATTPLMPYIRARLVAWARKVPVKNFMKEDLFAIGHSSTVGLCDFDAYLSECHDAPSNWRVVVAKAAFAAADLALVVLLCASVAAIAAGSFNPFIYFRF